MENIDLTGLKLNEYIDLLASDAPAPGGGAAAALAGSMGAALVGMVAAFTKGKEKYRQYEGLIEEISQNARKLTGALNAAVNRDAEAFGIVSAAYKRKKDTDAEKEARSAAIEAALKQAADAPFELMELVLRALALCESAVGKSNVSVASDLGVSAVLLRAAAQGAYINVRVNLSGIKDEGFTTPYYAKSARLLEEIEKIAGEILKNINI